MSTIEIYSSMMCPYCYRAKQLLDAKGVAYEEIDVMMQGGRRREMVERSGGRTSVPQIFIGGEHIGGCDDLYRLEEQGELDRKLEKVRAA